jgi:hypothetical protein
VELNGEIDMEKLCIFCEHFDWEGVGYTYYSTLTGGAMNGGATCNKQHYYEQRPSDEDELRALFLKAEACPDYAPPNNEERK